VGSQERERIRDQHGTHISDGKTSEQTGSRSSSRRARMLGHGI
jgi:hypothetical protein